MAAIESSQICYHLVKRQKITLVDALASPAEDEVQDVELMKVLASYLDSTNFEQSKPVILNIIWFMSNVAAEFDN